MTEKVRRIDWWFDDYLAAVVGVLDGLEHAVYPLVLNLIGSRGGEWIVDLDYLRRAMNVRRAEVEKALEGCIRKGKLHRRCVEGVVSVYQPRIEAELNKARARISDAKNGANSRWKNNETGDATAKTGAMPAPSQANTKPSQARTEPASPPPAAPRPKGLDRQFEDRLVDVAKLDPARWVGNFGMVAAWRNAGCTDADILAGISAVADRPGYRPPGSLNYFRQAIEDARDMRRAAEAKAGAPPGELERRQAAYDAAREEARAAGLKPEDPQFPRPARFGLSWADGRSVLLPDWKGPQSSQEAAA